MKLVVESISSPWAFAGVLREWSRRTSGNRRMVAVLSIFSPRKFSCNPVQEATEGPGDTKSLENAVLW